MGKQTTTLWNYLIFAESKTRRFKNSEDIKIVVGKSEELRFCFSEEAMRKIGLKIGDCLMIAYADGFGNRLYLFNANDVPKSSIAGAKRGYSVTNNKETSNGYVKYPKEAFVDWKIDYKSLEGQYYVDKDRDGHAFVSLVKNN